MRTTNPPVTASGPAVALSAPVVLAPVDSGVGGPAVAAPAGTTARVEGAPDLTTDSAPSQGTARGAEQGASPAAAAQTAARPTTDPGARPSAAARTAAKPTTEPAGAPSTAAQTAAEPSTEAPAPPSASDDPEDTPPAGAAAAGAAPSATDPCHPDDPAGYATSAAATFGWGKPNRTDDFSGSLGKSWGVYNGPGHGGKGRRTPDAVTVENGVLTITGDPQGNTAGMAWGDGQKYGRWEGRVKAPVGDRSYNALLLLWPDAENWPVGGEVDFMEMSDHTRQYTDVFLHYGRSNSQLHGEVKIDASEWHNWAVEWTPDHIAAFVDGKQWFHTGKKETLPPGPMHLCIQLDWFPKSGAAVQTSHMYVDWVRQYSLDPAP
jgi:hypothetical protein